MRAAIMNQQQKIHRLSTETAEEATRGLKLILLVKSSS